MYTIIIGCINQLKRQLPLDQISMLTQNILQKLQVMLIMVFEKVCPTPDIHTSYAKILVVTRSYDQHVLARRWALCPSLPTLEDETTFVGDLVGRLAEFWMRVGGDT